MSRLLQEIRSCATGPVHIDENGCRIMEFIFPSSFLGFAGHFPVSPILPGIVQIMAGILAVGGGQPLTLSKVVRTKFCRVISPGEPVLVRAESVRKASTIHANVHISVRGETAATMSLALDPSGCAQ